MTDVIYTVSGDPRGDWDYIWSIRGLKAFASNIGRIVVVGEPPVPPPCGVPLLPCDMPCPQKNGNILRAALKGFRFLKSDRALWFSDDFFLTRPCDLDTVPYYVNAEHPELPPVGWEPPLFPWLEMLADLRGRLERRRLPTPMCAMHSPGLMDVRDLAFVDLFDDRLETSTGGTDVGVLFAVAAMKRDPETKLVPRVDTKLTRRYTTEELDGLAAAGDGWMSVHCSDECGDFRKWYERLVTRPPRRARSPEAAS